MEEPEAPRSEKHTWAFTTSLNLFDIFGRCFPRESTSGASRVSLYYAQRLSRQRGVRGRRDEGSLFLDASLHQATGKGSKMTATLDGRMMLQVLERKGVGKNPFRMNNSTFFPNERNTRA